MGWGWHRGSLALTQGRAWGQLRALPSGAEILVFYTRWAGDGRANSRQAVLSPRAGLGFAGRDQVGCKHLCAGALGEAALRAERGTKPLSCFSSSDLALPRAQRDLCTHTQHPDGETEAGQMWVYPDYPGRTLAARSAPISVLFLCGVWGAAPSAMGSTSSKIPTGAPGSPGTGQWPLPVAVRGWHNVPAGRGLSCGREGGSAGRHNA